MIPPVAYALIGLGLVLVGIVASPTANATAGINPTINYQGRLLNASGAVIADGNYNMEFKIYQDGAGSVAGDTGGTLDWQEDYLVGKSGGVTVKNGYFSINLGAICALAGGACQGGINPGVNFNDQTLWLSMNVSASPNQTASCATANTWAQFTASCSPDGEMLPMHTMASAVYANNSNALGGLTSGQFVQLAQGIQSAATGTNPAIAINATGSSNLVTLQSSGTDAFDVSSGGNILLGNNANKTITVATATSGNNGNSLVVQSGSGTGTNKNGGDLILQGGSSTGSGTAGSVVVKPLTDSTTAFQVKTSFGSSFITADTTNGTLVVKGQTSDTTANALQVTNSNNDNLILARNDGLVRLGRNASSNSTLGHTAIGSTPDTGFQSLVSADKVVTGVVAPTVNSISFYVSSTDASPNHAKVGVYSDSSGNPNSLLASSASTAIALGWNTIPISYGMSANTTYWLGFAIDATSAGTSFIPYDAGSGVIHAYNTGVSYGTLPATFTVSGTSSVLESVYANVTESGALGTTLTVDPTIGVTVQTPTNSTGAFGVQNAGGNSLLNVDTSGNIVGVGATGSVALASTTNIGTSSNSSNVQTVNIGSTSDTSNAVTIEAGTGASSIAIGNSATTHGIKIGTGAGLETVSLGSTNGASATVIQGGTGNVTISTGSGSGGTGSISLISGNSSTTAAGNISIDTGSSVTSGTLVENKTFESSTEGLSCWFTCTSATQSTVQAHGGTHSLAVVESGGASWGIIENYPGISATAGHTYAISAWVRGLVAESISGGVTWPGSSAGATNFGTVTDTTSGWTQITGNVTAPAGATNVYFIFASTGNGTSTTTYLDDMTITDEGTVSAPAIGVGATNAQAINIGNIHEGGYTSIYGGGDGIQLQTSDGGLIALGTLHQTNIQVGAVGASLNNSQIDIADTGNANQVINIGGTGTSSGSSSGTTVGLQAGQTDLSLASSGATVQTFTNSPNAFQIQNATSEPILKVSTVNPSLIPNGSFESTSPGQTPSGWAGKGGGSNTTLASTTRAVYGSNSMDITTTTTAGDGAKYNITLPGSGVAYNFAADVYSTSTITNNFIFGYAADGTTETSCTTEGLTAATWTHIACSFTVASTSGTPYFFIKQGDTTARDIFVDGLQLEQTTSGVNFNEGNINVAGAFTNPVFVHPQTDITDALRVRGADGTTDFNIDTLNHRVGIETGVPTADLSFGSGGTRTINVVAPANTGSGNGLTIQAGSATTTGNGGNLLLQGGAAAGGGTEGSVIVKPQNNNTSAFQVLNAVGANVLVVDTTNDKVATNDLLVGSAGNVGTTGHLFSDGFETSGTTAWTSSGGTGLRSTVSTTVRSGKYSEDMDTSSGAKSAYLQVATVASPTIYGRTYFNVATLGNPTPLMDLGTAAMASGTHLYIYLGASGNLCYNYNAGAATGCSATAPSTGAWHKLETEMAVGTGANGVLQVWLDGTLVTSNANAINISNGTWTVSNANFAVGGNVLSTSIVYYDDVAVDTTPTGDSASLYVADAGHFSGDVSVSGNSSSLFNIQSTAGAQLLNVDTTGSHVIIGSTGGCSGLPTGKLCVNQTNASPSTATTATFNSTTSVTGTATGTSNIYGNLLNYNDTSTGGTGNDWGYYLDASGTTNAVASVNSFSAKITSSQPGNFLQFINGSSTVLQETNAGALTLENTANSTTALQVENLSGVAYFTVDTTNERLYVGPTAGDTTGALIVLGNKSTTADPTGVNGAMYYNVADGLMRCYTKGRWQACNEPTDLAHSYHIEEDFTAPGAGSGCGYSGATDWTCNPQGTGASVTGTQPDVYNRPGQNTMSTGTTTTGATSMYLGGAVLEQVFIGGGETIETAINLPTLSTATQEYTVRVGLGDNDGSPGVDFNNGVYFTYQRTTSTNWIMSAASGGARTETATTKAVATGWTSLKIIALSSTSLEFYVKSAGDSDYVDVGNVTTNIPNTSAHPTAPEFYIYKSAGTTASTMKIDYFDMWNDFEGIR